MVLLDLDPNVVKPGWTPLLITVGIAVVLVALFFSMRRQFRRIDVAYAQPDEPVADAVGPEPSGAEPSGAPGTTGAGPAVEPVDHRS